MGDVMVASNKKTATIKKTFLRSRKHLGALVGPTYKRGDLVRAVIIRTKKERHRMSGFGKKIQTGIYISFLHENAAIVL